MFLLGLVFGAGFLLTLVMRRYALARQLMDVPNARSSHQVPTPRGGGVSIVLVFICALLYVTLRGGLSVNVAVALAGSGLMVAIVGFLDDHGHVAARWRLLAHFLGAGWLLWWLGGMPAQELPGGNGLFPVWQLLATVYLVWLLNLYNFMDGIDGIAGIEAVTVCIGSAVVTWIFAPDSAINWKLPLVLGMASIGFLVWNFPPAKIFMGDAGSGFLGLMLGALSILAASQALVLFYAWLILLGVFIVDATVTLLRRILRGEKFYEAHRSHAYQQAARRFGAHRPVSVAVGGINVCWLLPIALLVISGRLSGVFGLVIAYVPLVLLAFRFQAGVRD